MSTLHQLLKERRLENAVIDMPTLTKEKAPSVQVRASNGDNWIFPWSHFIFGCLEKSSGQEALRLTFVTHEVSLVGSRLELLAEEAARLRLEKLRASKPTYGTTTDTEPRVDMIDVRAR